MGIITFPMLLFGEDFTQIELIIAVKKLFINNANVVIDVMA